MPNPYFRFRRFTVHQENSAMKVCTDSCLFGAWTASIAGNVSHVLDIGTGTGLLSLMLAQQCETAAIDALEIDENACKDAARNFADSPWYERLQLIHGSLQEFSSTSEYDFVISNPPFFSKDIHSASSSRNVAMHGSSLTLEELLRGSATMMAANGRMAILTGSRREAELESLCERNGFSVLQKCEVRQTPRHDVFRLMYLLIREGIKEAPVSEEIVIKGDDGVYTTRFIELLQDYYLQV